MGVSKTHANSILLSISMVMLFLVQPSAANFYRDVEINWGDGRGKIVDGGRGLTLSLDQYSGSGFQSKNFYLFGRFDVLMKLVPGNSAGTVATFFVNHPNYLLRQYTNFAIFYLILKYTNFALISFFSLAKFRSYVEVSEK